MPPAGSQAPLSCEMLLSLIQSHQRLVHGDRTLARRAPWQWHGYCKEPA